MTRSVVVLRGVNVNGVKVTSAALRERFGYEAFVVVLSADALRAVHDGYPFEREDDEHHPSVVFSSDADVLEDVAGRAGDDAGAEQLHLAGDVLYRR